MSFLNMIQRGNIQRIKELHDLGLRPEVIAEKFQAHGIRISVNLVNLVLDGELDELDRVAYPRRKVLEIEREIENLADGILPV